METVVYGIFREFSCLLFRRFQKPEISRCYGSPFWGKNEFAKKVIHYHGNSVEEDRHCRRG
jgi:hypothetical protein